jgi:hypothetical protein
MDLPNLHAVRGHAIGMSTALLSSNSPAFWRGEEWLIEAKDDIGVVLFTLAFRASDKPVIRQEATSTPLTTGERLLDAAKV